MVSMADSYHCLPVRSLVNESLESHRSTPDVQETGIQHGDRDNGDRDNARRRTWCRTQGLNMTSEARMECTGARLDVQRFHLTRVTCCVRDI